MAALGHLRIRRLTGVIFLPSNLRHTPTKVKSTALATVRTHKSSTVIGMYAASAETELRVIEPY